MSVLCNAAKVPNQPQAWTDLASPKYKGLIGMNDPSQSGPTYTFVAGMMQQLGGEDQGKAYFSSLKSNGLQIFPTNGDTIHALETGQIGCGVIQSSAAMGEQLKQKGKLNLVASNPSKATELPGVMGVAKGASPAAAATAKKFADWVLSPEGQKVILADKPKGASLYWPVVQGVSALPALPEFPQAQHIDPAEWGPKQGDIVNWFSQNVK
jgi:iron(III) transport system substrate-binding protein